MHLFPRLNGLWAWRRKTASGPALAVAAACWLGLPATAQDRLKTDLLKLYGGLYSSACQDLKAPRILVLADALVVEHAAKRVTGRKLQSAYSYYGNVAPAQFRVGLLSEVRTGGELNLIVFEDKRGPYISVQGDARVQAALGKALTSPRYRRCASDSALANAAPVPKIPAQDEPVSDAEKMLLNPQFRSAYMRSLGALARERWLAKLDGPRPPTRQVQLGGVDYVLIAVCKPHDCSDHNTALLYAADRGMVYGKVMQDGKSTLIGDPPSQVAAALDQLWAAEWRRK